MNDAQLERLKAELASALDQMPRSDLEVFNRNVVLTGASGFVGKWLLTSWITARQEFGMNGSLTCISRRASGYPKPLFSEAQRAGIAFHHKDVREMSALELPGVDWLVHGATPTTLGLSQEGLATTVATIVDGQRAISIFNARNRVSRMLVLSSGAVYGSQPFDKNGLSEDDLTGPDPLNPVTAYHEAKRLAEALGAVASMNEGTEVVSARLFAFLAPMLPLDAHFAAGNFIRDALAGSDIQLSGTGKSIRSYQYGTDLVTWLWTILRRGRNLRAYNVGSSQPIQICELAELIRQHARLTSRVLYPETLNGGVEYRYVPSVLRAERELHLRNRIDLDEAIDRMLSWHILN